MDYTKLLENKRVFINTGQRGIGKDIALLFARQGAIIALGGRNEQMLKQTMAEVQAISPKSKGYTFDLANGYDTQQALDKVLEDYGIIDILVNTVGVNKQGMAHTVTDDDLEWMLETNYKSAIRCARKVLPGMMEQKSGNIINISSIHGSQTMPNFTVYAGTKGAMNASARAMALEYAPYGIRINNLAPGLILSDNMMDEVLAFPEGEPREKFMKLLTDMQPLPIGSMENISNTALFLASDMSAYITGQTILVDGGASIKAH
jgi:Dehydrogenases with different specificities (related to short-chain alcohol dehydrogenases)